MKNRDYKEFNYFDHWTRRGFLKAAGVWAGAGILQPVLPLIGSGKSIAAAYPDEVLSIEKYTKGRVKPGMVISKGNAELVKDLSPEGLYIELTRGREIKIAETTTKPDSFVPEYWTEATLRNKGQAVLDQKGQLWTKDKKPWIGGDPFPEPRTGVEAMWNHIFNFRRYDDVLEPFVELDTDAQGTLLRRSEGFFPIIYNVGRQMVDPKPYNPKYIDELYRVSVMVFKPFDVYGLNVATVIPYDQTKLPITDAYIPALRRVRRLPSSQRFEPGRPYGTWYASDINEQNDPLLTWSWKLVERRPMLYPSPNNIGVFAKGSTKNDFVFPFTEEKFPRMTWELRPEVVVVEGIPHLEGAPYSRKRLYLDAIINRSACADIWDMQGKVWKWMVFPVGDVPWPEGKGGNRVRSEVTLFFADVQKDYRTNIWIMPENAGEKYRVNSGLTIEDWLTPAAMLKLARH
jgi:hypothetical protein